MKPRNIDVHGKTRPTSTKGIATPKTKADIEEPEGIIKGDAKKAGWRSDGRIERDNLAFR